MSMTPPLLPAHVAKFAALLAPPPTSPQLYPPLPLLRPTSSMHLRRRLSAAAYFLLVLLLDLLQLSPSPPLILALQFQYPSLGASQPNLTIVAVDPSQPGWYDVAQDVGYDEYSGAIWLTAARQYAAGGHSRAAGSSEQSNATELGRIVHEQPLYIGPSTSFTTSFAITIMTDGAYGDCGSGMAFFVADSLEAPTDSHLFGSLGLAVPLVGSGAANKFFAVEFDTRRSPHYDDPSGSHIGIDIDSLVSSNATDTSNNRTNPFYPDLYLYNNSTFAVWVDYDAVSTTISVYMLNLNVNTTPAGTYPPFPTDRPPFPFLQLQSDLFFALGANDSRLRRPFYVGFTATTAAQTQCVEGHAVHAWNFSSVNDLQLDATDSSLTGGANKNSKQLRAIIAGAASGGAALFIVVLLLFVGVRVRLRYFRPRSDGEEGGEFNDTAVVLARIVRPSIQAYKYVELRAATGGFDARNKIGEGGFSSVYKGTMPDGTVVAVKKVKEGCRKEAEFCAEVSIISQIRHRYLLELQGWCYESGEALLVYKYMANGSLDEYLFGKKRGRLRAAEKLKILEGVAAALEYLHEGLGECVLHRDVKAANVLLTATMEPKLSDFGLAKLKSHDEAAAMEMEAAGTPGFIAPELLYKGSGTDKADVYSFGVLALEVACERKAMDDVVGSAASSSTPLLLSDHHAASTSTEAYSCSHSASDYSGGLLDWAWMLQERGRLMDAVEIWRRRRAAGDDTEEAQAWKCVLHVALLCCDPVPERRPSMREVVQALRDRRLLPVPALRPAFPYGGVTGMSESGGGVGGRSGGGVRSGMSVLSAR